MDIKKEKYGFVYIWYNKERKMYYIGSHWGFEDDGYICSSNWMRNDYNRHKENFKRRIIKRVYNKKELYESEEYYLNLIDKDKINNANTTSNSRKNVRYYNLKTSNNNPWYNDPERIKTIGSKISFSKSGKSTGPCSEETKEKIRKSTKGVKKTYTEESYKSLVESRTGIIKSDEWKEAASERLKAQWDSGIRKGTPATEERKRKVSEANKGRQLSIPTEESRKKQSEKKKLYWKNVKAGLIPPRKPRSKKVTIDSLVAFHKDWY